MPVPLLLSLGFGFGVYLLFEGLTSPRRERQETDRLRRLRDFLHRSGLHDVSPRDFLLFSLGAGLLGALVTQQLLRWAFLSPLAGLLGACLPYVYFARREQRRRAVFQVALADAVAQLRDGIRTGLSVQEALIGLARTGPDVLRAEFSALVRESRLDGFETSLNALRDRLADPLFDQVAATLVLNEQLGGRNVSQVLDRLAASTRGQLRVQQDIRAQQAQNAVTALVMVLIPVFLLVAIRVLNPDYLTVFSVWPGQLVLIACFISLVVGYRAVRWCAQLPGEPRVLR